jgi:hypothetical protein
MLKKSPLNFVTISIVLSPHTPSPSLGISGPTSGEQGEIQWDVLVGTLRAMAENCLDLRSCMNAVRMRTSVLAPGPLAQFALGSFMPSCAQVTHVGVQDTFQQVSRASLTSLLQ